ncbi:hypothetical protein AGMMS50276_04490 [Synergistales bacterium]|nr:hypothetical protein AGMMS50276_04490 [Synergistales bacterium]
MTHTLHRVGTVESLRGDWVVLCMPSKDINHEGSAPKLQRFLKICRANHCVTLGDCRGGNEFYQGSQEAVLENVEDRAVVTATFNNEKDLVGVMKQLKEEDLGLSVIVSGLTDHVEKCCHEAGLKPHTVEHSLGRLGDTAKLPPQEILAIATMCGHSMVAVNFIYEMVEKVRKGSISAEQAAQELFKPCMCGIFNTDRAAKLIKALVA